MRKEIEHIQSTTIIQNEKTTNEIKDLEVASLELEAALLQMEKMCKGKTVLVQEHEEMTPGPKGMGYVPITHDAFFEHSSRSRGARWVWITKTVDKDGKLGFLALAKDTPRFGDKARKVFVRKALRNCNNRLHRWSR
jgi:hypothetical protein